MDLVLTILAVVSAVGVTVVLTYWYLERRSNSRVHLAQREAQRITNEAESRQRDSELAAKDEAIRLRADLDRDLTQRRSEIERVERRVEQKEETLDRKDTAIAEREQTLRRQEQEFATARDRRDAQVARVEQEIEQGREQARIEAEQARELARVEIERERQQAERDIADVRTHLHAELERIAGMTAEEAKQVLVSEVEVEARAAAARRLHEIDLEMTAEADRRARWVLATTIQRIASDYVAETTVSVVPIPSDDMKGRIIGREGRNIRALEQATGVDLIVDDTPEAIMISGFDPVRREIARRSLAKLLQDGRIHPARIEEVVAKCRQELDGVMREEGEKVAYEANVAGLHPDLIKLLGRLRFRTSYGQNVLHHSLETSLIAAALGAELGADINVCKTAALLHDIGKAVDHEVEGPHALIGADIAKRLGRSAKIVHAIAAHHNEEEPQTVEAFIVAAADAISGARPGARREMVEAYIKRLEALEGVANSFEGVEKSFAIQAGREVRILVAPTGIDDLGASRLARDVAKKIEESLEYPGQIKVTVIRETRAVDYAR